MSRVISVVAYTLWTGTGCGKESTPHSHLHHTSVIAVIAIPLPTCRPQASTVVGPAPSLAPELVVREAVQSAEHLPLTCWKLQDSVRGFTPIDTQNFRDGFSFNDFEEPIHINTSFGCHPHGQLMSPEPSNPPYDSPTLTWRSSSSQSLHGTPWRFRQGLQDGLGVERYGGILKVMWTHILGPPNLGSHMVLESTRAVWQIDLTQVAIAQDTRLGCSRRLFQANWCQDLAQTN